MNKAFNNFAWKNYPDTGTPLEKSVLDKINNGLDEVDNRVVTYDTTKFDTAQAQLLVKNVELNENSGVLKVTYYNGSVSTYSSLLGKVAVNFDFNEESQKMIVYLSNGEEKEVDLSSFIMEYEFLESDSIYFTIDENSKIAFEQRAESLIIGQHIRGVLEEDGGKYKHIIVESEVEISEIHGVYYDAVGEGDNIVFKRNISDPRHFISAYCPGGIAQFNIYVEVNSDAEDYGANKKVIAYLQKKGTVSAHIKEGSIQEKHLRPDYLADIKAEVAKAETSSENSEAFAKQSQSYAIGGTDSRTGEDTDNSKYYYQQSKSIYDNFSQAGNVTGVKGNAESVYRTGNVNLTAENVGALPATKEGRFFQKLNLYTEGYSYPSNCIHTQGLDLNQVNESGLYFCSNPVNAPSSSSNGNGFMIAITYAGKIRGMQLYMPVGEDAIYKRQNTNGSWGDWGKIKAGSATEATKATQDGNGSVIADTYAKKSIYGDTTVSLGRKSGSTIVSNSVVLGGFNNTASEEYSMILGGSSNTTSGKYSITLGGSSNVSSGKYSITLGGSSNVSSGYSSSILGGFNNTASSKYSVVLGGEHLSSSNPLSIAHGHYNAQMITGGSSSNTTGTALAIGNGTSVKVLSNAFSVMFDGTVKAKSTITGSTTADYAEFFEWLDGNPNNEDRVGRFVTLTGNKIAIANSNEDYILGIVSGEPFVLGNGDCDTWNGMYMKDDFNRTIYEPAPKIELNEETGERVPVVDEGGNPVYEGTRPKLNPEYDPDQPYISRFDRKEWSPVGMLGVLSVIDDGSCQVDGFCCCSTDGIATACEKETEGACRVIERISENVVRVVLK